MIYGCLIAHFTLTSTVHFAHHSWYQTWEGGVFNQPDLHLKQKAGSATTDSPKSAFSARLSNWNSSGRFGNLSCVWHIFNKSDISNYILLHFLNSVCFERIVKHWWGGGGLAVLANLSQDFLRLFLQPTTLYRESDWNFCPDFFTTDQSGSIKFLSWLEYIRRKDMHTWSTQCVSHTTKNGLKY